MNILKEKQNEPVQVLSIEICEADYAEKVLAALKKQRRTGRVPGFRVGNAPMGLIKKMYEKSFIADAVNDLIEGIQMLIERTPPQLASDVFQDGITLTGGGAQLYGLSEAISNVLKVPCRVADDPRDCTVLGCARVLEEPQRLRRLLNI